MASRAPRATPARRGPRPALALGPMTFACALVACVANAPFAAGADDVAGVATVVVRPGGGSKKKDQRRPVPEAEPPVEASVPTTPPPVPPVTAPPGEATEPPPALAPEPEPEPESESESESESEPASTPTEPTRASLGDGPTTPASPPAAASLASVSPGGPSSSPGDVTLAQVQAFVATYEGSLTDLMRVRPDRPPPRIPLAGELDGPGGTVSLDSSRVAPPETFRTTYDAFSAHEHDGSLSPYLQMSRTGSATGYYLAYGVEELASAWMATGDTGYLDRALEYIDNHLGAARPQSEFEIRFYDDDYLGWPAYQTLLHFELKLQGEYLQGEAQFARSAMRLMWYMSIVPSVAGDAEYGLARERIVAWIGENIVEKWYYRQQSSAQAIGWQVLNLTIDIDFYARWAHVGMLLAETSDDPAMRDLGNLIYRQTNGPEGWTTIPTGQFRSIRSQLARHPDAPGAYWWSDKWGMTPPGLGEDVSHAGITVSFATDAIWLGADTWNAADLAALRATLAHVRREDYRTALHVGGGAASYNQIAEWMRLGLRHGADDAEAVEVQLFLQGTRPPYRNFRAMHYAGLMLNAASHHYDPAIDRPYNETVGAMLQALRMRP